MGNTCGHCNFQGDLKEKRIFCLLKNEWIPIASTCENWIEYSHNMNKEDRVKYAMQARERLDSKESAKEQKRFQLWILVLGIVLGIVGTILTQWILKRLGLA